MPLPTYAPYAASKGALSTFTRSLAIELAHKGIRVNGIAVGSIYTDSVREALGTTEVSEATREMDASAATLVGRMGRPEDVARIALFLASEDADYMAGAIIPADGGRMISRKSDPFLKAQESASILQDVEADE
jgi:NAD(P)-dependent dehydrogenase (short-subunit alcohol dehydrogenase family)